MKQIAKIGMVLIAVFLLSGCATMRTNTKAPQIAPAAVKNLNINQSVTLKNVSTNSGEKLIGKWIGWKVYGDLYKYTDSSIGAARNILQRRNVTIKNDGDKLLKLEVYDASSVQGSVLFTVTASLRVQTGDGLEKEYLGQQKHGNGYGTTSAIEKALAQCVIQMLNDKDIIHYLES